LEEEPTLADWALERLPLLFAAPFAFTVLTARFSGPLFAVLDGTLDADSAPSSFHSCTFAHDGSPERRPVAALLLLFALLAATLLAAALMPTPFLLLADALDFQTTMLFRHDEAPFPFG
jgi:hypothetical protein